MKYPRGRLILFARDPVPGRVKTRLAAQLGEAAAFALYCRMLEYMLRITTEAGLAEVLLYATPPADAPALRELVSRHPVALRHQQGRDLGERMSRALETELRSAEFVILIGADAVMPDAAYLDGALRCLADGAPCVFGPAADGGYVLVGLREARSDLFAGIDWGTDRVMAQTRERCRALGLAPVELPERFDIDTAADLERLRRARPALYRQLTAEGDDTHDRSTG